MNIYWLFVVAIYLGGTETQNCKFPCDWRGKTFQIYQNGQSLNAHWTFTDDGISSFFETDPLDCFEISGEFILLRSPDTGNFICVLAEIFDENTFTVVLGGGGDASITNITCDSCNIEGGFIGQLTAVGVVAPVAPFPKCNKPSICSGQGVCPADRSLNIGTCDAQSTTTTTTPPATTTTTPASTTTTTLAATHCGHDSGRSDDKS